MTIPLMEPDTLTGGAEESLAALSLDLSCFVLDLSLGGAGLELIALTSASSDLTCRGFKAHAMMCTEMEICRSSDCDGDDDEGNEGLMLAGGGVVSLTRIG